jgi:hypothetical protein
VVGEQLPLERVPEEVELVVIGYLSLVSHLVAGLLLSLRLA